MPQTEHGIVGLVGGLGPESTIDYYRRILAAWAARVPGSAPGLVIDSLQAGRVMQLVSADRAAAVEYLLASVRRLQRAGARFVAITANTPHIVFDDLVARASIPLLSIVEVCADEAVRRGMKRLALLGSRITMDGTFYPEAFARRGMEIVVPHEAERTWVHDRYVGELLKGVFRDETRAEFEALVRRLRDEERVDGVILGGTELPLLLRSATVAEVPVLDTTGIHVAAIVQRLAGS